MDETVASWLTQALSLVPGEQLWLQAESPFAQKQLFGLYKGGLEKLIRMNPDYRCLSLSMQQADDKRWVVVTRHGHNPKVGFVKEITGSVKKVHTFGSEQLRRVGLMIQDGYDAAKIALIEKIDEELAMELIRVCSVCQPYLKNFPGLEDEDDSEA